MEVNFCKEIVRYLLTLGQLCNVQTAETAPEFFARRTIGFLVFIKGTTITFKKTNLISMLAYRSL